ncbi:hypothetical protein I3843_05G147700 [Carya illinoinensis]|uniref:peroxidase n=1 Tax=Carya illinoinensis TaxID=32201 RepID=A0A8T1QJ58_CARIL|nr:lignin-forming anionic peroxidase-like [Carya illinoinensis]KAG6654688.1 hypothetical protein CIPAW_05G163400 [Carya illinoinensis]KAG6713537.1 hypothetical protein I3842_05G158300 [Carya illinoinensis]KAG7979765.1 hypothetical protein I3843_05G147700 [Carya illinoinensis]
MASTVTCACLILAVFLFISSTMPCEAQLSSTFYDNTCPKALSTIQTATRSAVSRERRMAASLIRLHFHDCFVQGCDASILLDDTPSILGEKTAPNNAGSVRGYEVIDDIKSKVENVCPGVVSCADILAVVARDASVAVGGPSWTVKLGRRDSTTASLSLTDANLPKFIDGLGRLTFLFREKGLSERDMVALSGSHTIGQARCVTFRGRIHNNASDIDAGFASTGKRKCSLAIGSDDEKIAPLDLVTPNSFDNNYFKNLIQKKGLLQSDQILFSGGSTDSIVTEYSKSPSTFKNDFAAAMVRMGDIEPITGSQGQMRKLCSVVN